jgi:hypothetical protein
MVMRAATIMRCADKAYDVREFVDDLRDLNFTPHIAKKHQPQLGDRRAARARPIS